MRIAYILPVVACLLNAITTVNASEYDVTIDLLGNCESVFHSEDDKTYTCNKGLYCLKYPSSPDQQQQPAMCVPVCDTCYSMYDPATRKPSSQAFCAPGYASYMSGYTPEGVHACHICEKGWYSENPDNKGLSGYVPGSTPYPGNVGCVKCPYGYTTPGRGVGASAADCTFMGQLPAAWKDDLNALASQNPETAYSQAFAYVESAQADLLKAGQAIDDLLASSASLTRSSSEMQDNSLSIALSMEQSEKVMLKAAEMYDSTTGKMTCMKMEDCHMLEVIARREEIMTHDSTSGQDYQPHLACVKDSELAEKGVCLEKPHLQGNPIPDCLESCPHFCIAAEAARQSITVDEFFASEPDSFGTELCSCFTACDTSKCQDPQQKDKVGHLWRDWCRTKDPFYVAPTTPATGGNNLKCGFGQYLKYKNVPNMEECTDCPRGRFAKAKTSRNKECKRCPRGWIQPDTKQGRCNRCPSGTKANKERTACA